MTEPGARRGKDRDIEAEASTSSSDKPVQSPEEAVATTKAAIQKAKVELDYAKLEEDEYWEEKRPRSRAPGHREEFKATWSFWKGDDWAAEEKRDLAKAQAAILLGLGGLAPVIASVFTFESARAGLDAANDRVKNESSAVNLGLEKSAEGTLAAAATGVGSASYAYFAVLVGGVLAYYHVCEKHAENVTNLNKPDVAKRRERLQKWLDGLQRRLEGEQRALEESKEAMAARKTGAKGLTLEKD